MNTPLFKGKDFRYYSVIWTSPVPQPYMLLKHWSFFLVKAVSNREDLSWCGLPLSMEGSHLKNLIFVQVRQVCFRLCVIFWLVCSVTLSLHVLKIIVQDPMFGKPKNMPQVHESCFIRGWKWPHIPISQLCQVS